MHQNCRFVSQKKEELEVLLHEVKPAYFCISELALKLPEVNHFCLENYQLGSYHCRTCSHRGGGVAIFFRNEFSNRCKPVDVANFCIDRVFEACAIQIDLEVSFILVCVYRPPNNQQSSVDEFIEALQNLLHHLSQIRDRLVLMGDFNICVLTDTYRSLRFRETLAMFNLISVLTEPTRGLSCIDGIFTSLPLDLICTKTLETGISDHKGTVILITRSATDDHVESPPTYYRDFNQESIDNFKYFLAHSDWDQILAGANANDGYSRFSSVMNCLLQLCFPLKKGVKSKYQPRYSDPHLLGLKNEIIALSELMQTFKDSKLSTQLAEKKKAYRQHLLEKKKVAISSKLNASDNKAKTSWQVVNNEFRQNKINKGEVILKNENGGALSPRETCEKLNDHFLSVASSTLPRLDRYRGANNAPTSPVGSPTNATLFLYPVTEEETLRLISGLKNKPSVGWDGLPAMVLKQVGQELARPLTLLINLSFSEGFFPDDLKIARVVPVFKTGDRSDEKNYRPISILPVVSKLYEYAILDRLLSFLEEHNILSDRQFGFRKGKSTGMAVASLYEKAISDLEKGMRVAANFIDITKAFDCVNKTILLGQLYNYGIRGIPLQLVDSYLTDRRQFVSLTPHGGVSSSMGVLVSGVPQGSILGPFLFITYINSLVPGHYAYADDITGLISAQDYKSLEVDSNVAINELTQNLATLDLLVNTNKTGVIIFNESVKTSLFSPSILIDDQEVARVSTFKCLGMVLDQNMKWDNHVMSIIPKIASGLFVLRKISTLCPREVALSVYHALISSHMRYGIVLWGACSGAYFSRVFRLQKQAIRYILHLPKDASCKPHFLDLKILTLPGLYIFEVCCYVKKNPSLLQYLGSQHNYPTRSKQKVFQVPMHTTSRFENTPSYRGTTYLNKLPEGIRLINDYKTFKKVLWEYLIQRNLYCIDEL